MPPKCGLTILDAQMFLMNEQSKARTWPSTTLRPMRLKGEQMAALFVDFLPVLKGGDSLNHAVSWFKGGSH